MKKHIINKNIYWEETGKITIHNYPPIHRKTASYITFIYKEHNTNYDTYKEIEGPPIYLDDLPPLIYQITLAFGELNNAIHDSNIQIFPNE
jgi:hypothetical protein